MNIDPKTVRNVGDEWSRFDQSSLSDEEAKRIFGEYFAVFPWERLPQGATCFDMGCGSGRWAKLMRPRLVTSIGSIRRRPWMLRETPLHVRRMAPFTVLPWIAVQRHFSLDEGVARYRDIYDRIDT
jgi:hypothetical protein